MRRFFRYVRWACAVLVGLLLIAYILRKPLLARPLAQWLAAELSTALDGEVTLERIDGNWIFDTTLVGLRIETRDATIDVPQATLSYRLWGLFGDRPQDAIRSVEVVGAHIALDATLPSEGEPVTVREILGALPRPLPPMQIDGSLRIRTAAGPVRCGGFVVAGRADGLDVRVTELELPDLPPTRRFSLSLAREGGDVIVLRSADDWQGLVFESARYRIGETLEATVALGAGRARVVVGAAGALRAELEEFEPRRLPGAGELPEGRVTGSVEVEGDLVRVAATAFDLRTPDFAATSLELLGEWRGRAGRFLRVALRTPDGRVDAEDVGIDLDRPFVVERVGRLTARVPDLRAYVRELRHAVSVTADLRTDEKGAIVVERLEAEGAGSSVKLSGAAMLPATREEWKRTEVTLSLEAVVGDLNRLVPDLPRISGSVSVAGSVAGTLAEPRVELDVAGRDLVVDGRRVQSVRVDGSLRWPELDLRAVDLRADAGRVQLSGLVDVEAPSFRQAKYDLKIDDLRAFSALFPGLFSASGRLQGKGDLSWSGAGGFVGSCELSGDRVEFEGLVLGAIGLSARADGDRLTVSRLEVNGPEFWIQASGAGDPMRRRARIEKLAAGYGESEIRLRAPLALAWDDGGMSATGIDARLFGGTIAGSAEWRAGRPIAHVSGKGLQLAKFAAPFAGVASIELDVDGENFTLLADIPRLRAEGHEGRVNVSVRQDAKSLRILRLDLDADDALEMAGEAALPFRLTAAGLVRAPAVAPWFKLSGRAHDLARLLPIEAGRAVFDLEARGEGIRGEVRASDLVLGEGVAFEGDLTATLQANRERAEVVVSGSRVGPASLSGRVATDRGFDWTRPLRYETDFDGMKVDGNLQFKVPDLGVLRRLIPDVLRLGGRAAMDLAFSGDVLAPKIDGEILVEELSCAVEGDLPPVRRASGRILVEKNALRIEKLAGEMGYAPVSIEGGARLDESGEPVVDLVVRGENALLSRNRHLRLRADLDVKLTGPIDAMLAQGTVAITDALYSQPIDLLARGAAAADAQMQLFSIREGPLSRLRFDVAVTARETIHIRNNVLRGAFSADIRLGGTGLVPEPEGRISFRNTLVDLPFSSLRVRQGELRFPPESPFSPRILVSAATKMQGYELSVTLSGEMPDPQVLVSSQPSLSQDDAILLLTTGATSAELRRQGLERGALTRVATFVGKRLVRRVGGPDNPDEEGFFERFSLAVGREQSRRGSDTVEAEFRLLDRWYLRAERDRFDDYNFGIVWRFRFR